MSRAFLSESDNDFMDDDFPEVKYPLPEGVKNYMTQEGAERMENELTGFLNEERPELLARSIVFVALGDAVSGAAGGAVWSILLVVVGNAVVIALEGLVVAVQTLRLEYYEFFNKFFSGEGRVYKPFDLQSEES